MRKEALDVVAMLLAEEHAGAWAGLAGPVLAALRSDEGVALLEGVAEAGDGESSELAKALADHLLSEPMPELEGRCSLFG
jgi:hypothetical protein